MVFHSNISRFVLLAGAFALLHGGEAQAVTRDYSIYFDPATTTCGFFVRAGICSTSQTFAAPVSANAGDVFHIQVTTPLGAPMVVPGSATSNGIYVDAYDAGATLGPGGPGPIQTRASVIPLGLITTANVAPYVNSTTSRSFDYLGTSGYSAVYGTPNDGFSVTGIDARLTVLTPDPLPTIGVSAGYFWNTNDIPVALALLGGTEDAAVILPDGLVGKISGTIGDPAGPTEQFYNFNWLGGFFQTRASLVGAGPGAEFTFQLKSLDGSYKSNVSLNDDNGFSTLFGDNLSSGRYLIGLRAGAVLDPAFTFDFLTPVGNDSVPEPSTWALLIAGFGGVGAMMRRRRCAVA
jgi:hypothetical protein